MVRYAEDSLRIGQSFNIYDLLWGTFHDMS